MKNSRGELVRPPRPDDLEGVFTGCQAALEQERKVAWRWLRKYQIEDGVPTTGGSYRDADADGFYYRFEIGPVLPDLPVGTRCAYQAGGRTHAGVLETSGAGWLIVGLDHYLGQRLRKGLLSFDLTFLLKQLAAFLQDARDDGGAKRHRARLHRLLCTDWEISLATDLPPVLDQHDLNPKQRDAVALLLETPHGLIWGPPGTGKTRTIAAALRTLHTTLPPDQQLLVCAHTNVAVDNVLLALMKLLDRDPSDLRDRVIRFGKVGAALTHYGVTLDQHFERHAVDHETFLDLLRACEAELPEVSHDTVHRHGATSLRRRVRDVGTRSEIAINDGLLDENAPILKRVDKLLGLRDDLERACLGSARIVGTTLTKLYMNATSFDPAQFSLGIVDELSIAGIPLTIVPAWFCRRLVGVGDFRQLPPIVLADEEEEAAQFLGQNLFHWTDCEQPEQRDRKLVLLDTQYRMAEPICDTVSQLYYDGSLQTAPEVGARETVLHVPLRVLDSSDLRARAERPAKDSMCNPLHADLVAMLLSAFVARGVHDIGVVTPYRAQAQRIKSAWRAANQPLDSVEISTVHRYQGREKQLVIFDTVLAAPETSRFLNDRTNADLSKILNVAGSRARECLIVLGDLSYLERQYSKRGALPLFCNTAIAYSERPRTKLVPVDLAQQIESFVAATFEEDD